MCTEQSPKRVTIPDAVLTQSVLLKMSTIVFETYRGMLIKIQPDATVCRYLFTAKLLYMSRVLQHPSSEVLKTVTAASGTGYNTGTATSLQRGLIGHVGGK